MKWIKLLFINKQMTKFQILRTALTDQSIDVVVKREAIIKLEELIKNL